jgi:protein-S-isoprenylcysteine O-methyltransferase Ste14
MAAFLQRGGAWVLGQTMLILAVIVLALRFRGDGHLLVMFVPGAVLLGVGAIIGLSGAIGLRRGLTPFPKPSQDMRLVQNGIYAVIRHPLYTSVMTVALGWALVWQSWPALLAGLALILFLDLKSRREERWLREQFPEYAEYAKRVRRFIPSVC